MAEDSIPSIPQWGSAGSKEGKCSVKERSLLLGTQCRGRKYSYAATMLGPAVESALAALQCLHVNK